MPAVYSKYVKRLLRDIWELHMPRQVGSYGQSSQNLHISHFNIKIRVFCATITVLLCKKLLYARHVNSIELLEQKQKD